MAKKTSKTKKTNDLQAEPAVPESTLPELEAAPATGTEAAVETVPQVEIAATAEEPEAKEVAANSEAEKSSEPESEAAPESEAIPEPESEENSKPEESTEPEDETEPEFTPQPRPPAKLERLQKILAAAGVASRRHAEEMIEQGRVEVNGKVVTVLGTKADAARDHIRVDGKLLHGAERLRYFVLNKPKGFVTTVKDPEGRPTVMQFFEKMKERLYPVGRLDYMSEGLLVVTNDGELANRLTKAGSGVEKTYLVKVAGQPTEAELDILRNGVAIERGQPGSPKVRTSPARVRQVRQGDNPWYEVILIEGRNRELRKMFEEIGHFVEKIRRIGYGPLVLDQEPGHLRELLPEELDALRKAAEGKLRTPKSKELRRRNAADSAHLPTVLPKPSSRPRTAKPMGERPAAFRPSSDRPGGYRPGKAFGAERPRRSYKTGETNRTRGVGPAKFAPGRAPERPFTRPDSRSAARPAGRPAWKKDERPSRPPSRFAAGSTGTGRPFTAKPAWKKPERQDRPPYQRPAAPRRAVEEIETRKPSKLYIEPVQDEERFTQPGPAKPFRGKGRPFTASSGKPRAGGARPGHKPGRPFARPARPSFRREHSEGSFAPRPPRPASGSEPRPHGQRSSGPRPSRPYTPRTGGASDYRPTKARPYPKSASRAERKDGPGWKPGIPTDMSSSVGRKPRFGGKGKPASGSHSRPRPGGFSNSGYKGKPGGSKRSGFRPGGKPGGKRRG